MPKSKALLLEKYYNQGWLKYKYIDGLNYHQPYNDEERLLAGKLFYNDYITCSCILRCTNDFKRYTKY
jgi:hypothetical protein